MDAPLPWPLWKLRTLWEQLSSFCQQIGALLAFQLWALDEPEKMNDRALIQDTDIGQ